MGMENHIIHNEHSLNKQGGHNTQAAGSVRGSFLLTGGVWEFTYSINPVG